MLLKEIAEVIEESEVFTHDSNEVIWVLLPNVDEKIAEEKLEKIKQALHSDHFDEVPFEIRVDYFASRGKVIEESAELLLANIKEGLVK